MKPLIPDRIVSISWSLLWLMLPLSMRGTLLFLWLFGLTVLYQIIKSGIHKPTRQQLIGFGLFALLLCWIGISLFINDDVTGWLKSLEKKSALLIIPLLLIGVDQQKLKLEKWAIRGFFAGLLISGMIMFLVAGYRSLNGEAFLPWTYHEFASPFKLGAIYASWYFSAALIYLVFREQESIIEKYKPFLISFFLVTLLLLASKLFIILTIPVLIWQLYIKTIQNKKRLITLGIILALVIGVSSPFILRLSELNNTDFEVLEQESFSYDTPLNGLTFRMLQWRFASEILTTNKAWFTGVGINNSQTLLDKHYQLKGIYTGNSELGDSGYLGYNYHNQYLETLVSTGIVGLIILMLIILNIFMNKQSKQFFPLYVYIVSVLFFFTESVLDRQAGIIFFCLLVFTLSDKLNKTRGSHSIWT